MYPKIRQRRYTKYNYVAQIELIQNMCLEIRL